MDSQRYQIFVNYSGRWVVTDRSDLNDSVIVASSHPGLTSERLQSVTHPDGGACCGTVHDAIALAPKRAAAFCKYCLDAGYGPEHGAVDWPVEVQEGFFKHTELEE